MKPGADDFLVPAWLRAVADITFWVGAAVAVIAGLALGRSLTATPILGLALGLITIAFFHVTASWEERRLAERFDGHTAHAAATPRFIPVPPRSSQLDLSQLDRGEL